MWAVVQGGGGGVGVCVAPCVVTCVAIAMCARAFSASFNPLIYSYPQRKKIIQDGDESTTRHSEMNDRRSHTSGTAHMTIRGEGGVDPRPLCNRASATVNQVRLDRRNESILKRGLVVG